MGMETPILKLISLNIERSKHVERVIPFLRRERPDVLCLQELMEYDIGRFEDAMEARAYFTPVTIHPAEGKPGVFGQGLFSRLPVQNFLERYYWGSSGTLPHFDFTNAATKHASETHVVSACDVEKDGMSLRIATTHFTWTSNGQPDDFQRADLKNLFSVLATLGEFALIGDFNAPRGGEVFSAIAAQYKDNIPARYTTSIDPQFHRKGALELMVDGLFTTPRYEAHNVRLVERVSDHLAIVADISLRQNGR